MSRQQSGRVDGKLKMRRIQPHLVASLRRPRQHYRAMNRMFQLAHVAATASCANLPAWRRSTPPAPAPSANDTVRRNIQLTAPRHRHDRAARHQAEHARAMMRSARNGRQSPPGADRGWWPPIPTSALGLRSSPTRWISPCCNTRSSGLQRQRQLANLIRNRVPLSAISNLPAAVADSQTPPMSRTARFRPRSSSAAQFQI